MSQNAPNPISIYIFFPGVTPGPPPLGLCPQIPGEGREGGKGKGKEGEEKGRRKVCVIAVGGINASELM